LVPKVFVPAVQNAYDILRQVEPGAYFRDETKEVPEQAIPFVIRVSVPDAAEPLARGAADDPMHYLCARDAGELPQLGASELRNVVLEMEAAREVRLVGLSSARVVVYRGEYVESGSCGAE
jgi:hypothetical protein